MKNQIMKMYFVLNIYRCKLMYLLYFNHIFFQASCLSLSVGIIENMWTIVDDSCIRLFLLFEVHNLSKIRYHNRNRVPLVKYTWK